MKKLLIPVLASLFLLPASAADVQIYGTIDAGLSLTHLDRGNLSNTSFVQTSGAEQATIFGFRGTEEISPVLTAGFDLESGFSSDDGVLGFQNRLFGRKSFTYLKHDQFGQIKLGRVPAITTQWHRLFTPYDATPGAKLSNFRMLMSTVTARPDNTIDYESPSINGFTVSAQYSMNTNSLDPQLGVDAREGTSDVERYAGLGLRYRQGNFAFVSIADYVDYRAVFGETTEDGYALTLGGSYKFADATRVYLMLHGFTHSKQNIVFIGQNTANASSYQYKYGEGFSAMIGAEKPFGNVSIKFAFGQQYAKADQTGATDGNKVVRTLFRATCQYRFSKRTSFYTGVGYSNDAFEGQTGVDGTVYGVESGLIHTF